MLVFAMFVPCGLKARLLRESGPCPPMSKILRRLFSSSRIRFLETPSVNAPRAVPDLRSVRSDVGLFEENVKIRNYKQHENHPRRITELAELSSQAKRSSLEPRKKLKSLQKTLAAIGSERRKQDVLPQINELQAEVDRLDQEASSYDRLARDLALSLPNLTSSHTPLNGEPKILSYINYDSANPPQYASTAHHSAIGQKLDLLDFTSSSATSGWGFYYLLNEAALLEQALVQYALSVAMRHGWKVVTPPSLVYSHIADACGFQPRDQNGEQQIWQVAQPERDIGKPKRSLAATAEIPFAGLHANKDIKEEYLPVKVIGPSRCYRAEAGARGVDTRGLYRVHEFTKVEMFAWTDSPTPAADKLEEAELTRHSTQVFDEMVKIQIEMLSSLGLPCRVLEMPSTDLGASAYRKIDIEAMFPSRQSRDEGWGEVTSVSICTDYQSRRLNTKIEERSGARKKFPHTVNGTAVAVPRVLAAILENGWREEEGCVIIPEVLRPYIGGLQKIGPR